MMLLQETYLKFLDFAKFRFEMLGKKHPIHRH